jgi:hypothetical protein
MALQRRTGTGGKGASARRKSSSRTRRKRRRPPLLLLLALGLLIAGFLVRRALVPRMTQYLAYRAPERPAGAPQAGVPAHESGSGAPGEHLTPSDRQQLEQVIRQKSK